MTEEHNEKIIRLETMLAHQEKQIGELNEVVHQQWKEIEILKTRLNKTQDKILVLEEDVATTGDGKKMSVTEMARAEKPPHY